MVTSAIKTPRHIRDCKVVMMDLLWISLQFVFRGAAPTPRESVVISPRHARRRLEFSRGFQPTGWLENIPASRQRRLNSIVADATGNENHGRRGLKTTAKFPPPL